MTYAMIVKLKGMRDESENEAIQEQRGRKNNTSGRSIHSTRSSNHSSTVPPKGYIYITIGPQNAGKTTILSQILSSSSFKTRKNTLWRDVTLDDQVGVYVQVPVELCFHNPIEPSQYHPHHHVLLSQIIHGKSIAERLYHDSGKNDEMRFVVQRLSNQITKDEFQIRLRHKFLHTMKSSQSNDSSSGIRLFPTHRHWIDILADIVEEQRQRFSQENHHQRQQQQREQEPKHDTFLPPMVDLFIVEALFQRSTTVSSIESTMNSTAQNHTLPSTRTVTTNTNTTTGTRSGIETAIQKLHQMANDPFLLHPKESCSWGNTNTKPRDYIGALEAAEKSQRPVYFIPFMDPEQFCLGSLDPRHHYYLPILDLDELIRRNIQRLIQTGRYIPCPAILDTCQRIDQLMNDVKREMGIMDRNHQDPCLNQALSFHGHRASFTQTMKEVDKNNQTIAQGNEVLNKKKMFTKVQLDRAFAKLAGYHMYDDHTVEKITKEKNWNRVQQNKNRSN